jgi:hypothetical protein
VRSYGSMALWGGKKLGAGLIYLRDLGRSVIHTHLEKEEIHSIVYIYLYGYVQVHI